MLQNYQRAEIKFTNLENLELQVVVSVPLLLEQNFLASPLCIKDFILKLAIVYIIMCIARPCLYINIIKCSIIWSSSIQRKKVLYMIVGWMNYAGDSQHRLISITSDYKLHLNQSGVLVGTKNQFIECKHQHYVHGLTNRFELLSRFSIHGTWLFSVILWLHRILICWVFCINESNYCIYNVS